MKDSQKPGCRLQRFHSRWSCVPDPWCQEVLRNGLFLPLTSTPPPNRPRPSGTDPDLLKGIQDFLEKGAIVKSTSNRRDRVYSMPFLVRQPDKIRTVLDATYLNQFIKTAKFKMESIETLAGLLEEGDFMVKIDVKDAYLHVPIHPRHRHLLSAEVGGTTYEFCSLPFGVSSAPMVFNRLMRGAITPMREMGIRLIFYLDDLLILGNSLEQAREHGRLVARHLQALGFILNASKTTVDYPSKTQIFLGFTILSETLSVKVPSEKVRKIGREAESMRNSETTTVLQLSRLLGAMISMARAIPYAKLMGRFLQRDLRKTMSVRQLLK